MGDMGIGSIVGGVFSYLGAQAQAQSAKDIAQMQLNAIKQQRDYVAQQLDPASVSAQALNADMSQATNRLALQAKLDPGLTSARYSAENNLAQLAANPNGQGDALANQLVSEVGQPDPATTALKNKLMDHALDSLDQGAKLPPDVQAELIKAGLERSGTMGTGTSKGGAAGDLSTRLIGLEGVQLQSQRQKDAQSMADTADTLANRRYALLASIFPSLKNLQTSNANMSAGIFGVANGATPAAGLGGADLTNVLMARVGANNSLTSQQGNVLAAQGAAQGAAGAAAYGALGAAASGAATSPASSYLWNNVFNGKSGGTATGNQNPNAGLIQASDGSFW